MEKDFPQEIKDTLVPSGVFFLSLEDSKPGHLISDDMSWKDLLVALENQQNKGEPVIFLFDDFALELDGKNAPSWGFDRWIQIEGEYETRVLWKKEYDAIIEKDLLNLLPQYYPVIGKLCEKQLATIDVTKLGYGSVDGAVMELYSSGLKRFSQYGYCVSILTLLAIDRKIPK
jgi:hypothetical protein